jgi:transposase
LPISCPRPVPLAAGAGGTAGRWSTGLLWKLCTGARWRDQPERYGIWQTVYEGLTRWRLKGLFDTILDRLRLKLNAAGLIDRDL